MDTPAGVEVGTHGCAVDSDGDGVANYQDSCPSSEVGARVNAEGCYIILTETREIELQVNFSNNSFVVSPGYFSEIQAIANFMTEYPVTEAVIEGYTDSRGSAEYNQALSERRAAAVAEVLIKRFSIASNRVSAIGYGEAQPVASNDTVDGRSANRRVVAVISATVETRAE